MMNGNDSGIKTRNFGLLSEMNWHHTHFPESNSMKINESLEREWKPLESELKESICIINDLNNSHTLFPWV